MGREPATCGGPADIQERRQRLFCLDGEGNPEPKSGRFQKAKLFPVDEVNIFDDYEERDEYAWLVPRNFNKQCLVSGMNRARRVLGVSCRCPGFVEPNWGWWNQLPSCFGEV
jgi:hypothetical protein